MFAHLETLSQYLHALSLVKLPANEARMLLLHLLGRPVHERSWLLSHADDKLENLLPADQHAAFDQALTQAVERRLAGEPLAYIVGRKAFYGLDLVIDARVLDPRPDTETLVDWALQIPADALPATAPVRVLDLGTGSGAIALALQQERPQWHVAAVDASHDALAVARTNAQRLQLPVQLAHGHWLDAPDLPQQPWHLIVSNPPYIRDDDEHLSALRHEPRQALSSGADGLDDIRTIVAQARQHLLPGGWLLLEHGYDQASAVRALLQEMGYQHVQSRCDLAGIERCTGGQWRA
ncbi:peptide chain release factor N(5)-glutamine methyltransferase [Curvibacter sp. CHRR-16]|uniref:peptide chain release factor N(5)-glutamine methyltransferase n=1 Tax=Curvibacter sp. CHRR-16 TaxID=2835872 RepID=UPI001BD95F91|nr:peptide chain release factor N(5)-glutamine methyltransferase [Curvibacter sp. CHRR-16]MBT0569558.1 peptide chain release factor N(5)-glutamine methyltransferase [Curvibacter sp. CHRR-16]